MVTGRDNFTLCNEPPRLCQLPAHLAARLIQKGEISSKELMKSHLARVAARESTIRGWAFLDQESAIDRAAQRDSEKPHGVLHGVPVAIKDLIDTRDIATSYGSRIYAGHRPRCNASCVTKLEAAGAVLMGKTVTTEFATFQPAATRNPAAPGRSPGGSSSGSAAVVADYMAPLALGTQTAGSVIRPASYCGIFGFKPTYGAISFQGIKALSASLDTVGVFARSEEDLVLLWNVLVDGRWHQRARMRLPMRRSGPIRVALAELPESHLADDSVHAALEAMAGAIAGVCHVGRIALAGPFEQAVDAHKTIMAFEAAGALDHEYRVHRAALGQQVLTMIEEGRRISRESYEQARRVRHECTSALASVFAQHDALLVPSATGEPPMGLAFTGDPVFCRAWSLVGCPAASVPVACGPSGAPIGLQLVGAPGRDEELLAVLLRIAPQCRSAP